MLPIRWLLLVAVTIQVTVVATRPASGDEPHVSRTSARAGQAARAEGPDRHPYLMVLGIAQDAGYPQAGCHQSCCQRAWADPTRRRGAVCLAIVDPQTGQRWLVECTPDFRDQLHQLDRETLGSRLRPGEKEGSALGLDGILLTHAHIGHYAGLVHLGREVMGVQRVPVYTMPRMRRFLETNGPWDQLVSLNNIELRDLSDGQTIRLNGHISVSPFLVPHRDEYSETIGLEIRGPARSAIWLPDIDKWDRWKTSIEDVLARADVAYLDGTFYADGEIPGRNMAEIPHPFIVESIQRFRRLPHRQRDKVRFLHLNHTNPVLDATSAAAQTVRAAGHHVARQGERFEL